MRLRLVTKTLAWMGIFTFLPGGIKAAEVEGQPLAANALRVIDALEYLGVPMSKETVGDLQAAAQKRDAEALQKILDPLVLFEVHLNPEVRVKVSRGPAKAVLQQGGFTPFLVKVNNDSTVAGHFQIRSPQSGPVYSGAAMNSLKRMAQTELNDNENTAGADRFLQVEMFQSRPMTEGLSGLEVEYAVALIGSSEAGKREATIGFDVGVGTQDVGFRGEVPVLFEVKPAVPVKLKIRDHDGTATTAKLVIRDPHDRVYPLQAKRVAPDLFFQPQIYRHDGGVVLLPPGELSVEYSRGPEYRVLKKILTVEAGKDQTLELDLQRWVDPMKFGFYCGDHHIHAAGCAHYTSPSEGIDPADVFLQVKGEGLNVGSVLNWGYCWQYQRGFFSPKEDRHSEALTLLKYDIEVSGFGSAAMGHVCLLNLKQHDYPGSEGSMRKGWPTWTVPVMRWCREQGGVTGYPHSSLRVEAEPSARETLMALDKDGSGDLSQEEALNQVLPGSFDQIDADHSFFLSEQELVASTDLVLDELPNLAVPPMTGGGALEIFVSTTEGVCDFISAMDTQRIGEWNIWYHLLNSGFPMKVSGETDFPCMSSRRVGQGRVYVQLGEVEKLDYTDWCEGIRRGASYVSDGFAHALKFEVNGSRPGGNDVVLAEPGKVRVEASVAFAPEVPKAVAYGQIMPAEGRRAIGNTVVLHAERNRETVKGGERLVEVIVNGKRVDSQKVPADGELHELTFDVKIDKSSWVALRHFPQMHTNPVNVIVGEKPIRASRSSALWSAEAVKRLWKNRSRKISEAERSAARAAYDRAIAIYGKRASEAPAGS
jgi:hypothetical protein